jgi:hypothetical protein
MNLGDVFNGFRVDWIVRLPADHSLVLGYFLDASIEPNNHNIFRLDKDGNVVWQVQRDEQFRPSLEEANRKAMLEGREPERDSFGDLPLIYADGTNNGNLQTGNPPNEAQWVPGCTVRARTFSGKVYELDIKAGIARNIVPRGARLW